MTISQNMDSESYLLNKLRKSYLEGDMVRLDNALHLCAEKSLGNVLSSTACISIAKRTTEIQVAVKHCIAVAAPKEQRSFAILAVTCFGLCASKLEHHGILNKQLAIVLGLSFLNRFLADTDSLVRRLTDIKVKADVKMVRLFLSWWSTLDDDLLQRFQSVLSESSSRLSFKRDPQYVKNNICRRYMIQRGRQPVGIIRWDDDQGTPDHSRYGWVATLLHGFDETEFRSGRSSDSEPYTAVHKNEVKLHNPNRLSFELAKTWARTALRV